MPKKPQTKGKKTKAKIGRPTKMTVEVVKKLTEAFKDDFTVEEACRYAGISKETYYQECKRKPGFADEMARAQDYPLTLAKKAVFRGIQGGVKDYGTLALKFLERRQRDRYTPKVIQEHEGGITMTYQQLEQRTRPRAATPDEARRLADEAAG